MSMVYLCTITLSLSHSLVSTAMMTSFPSIPWGQLCTCVPTDWETHNLPIIMLSGEDWDPMNVGLGNGQSSEQAEMQTIWSLETECELNKLSSMLHERYFVNA